MADRIWFIPAKDDAIFVPRPDGSVSAIDEDGAHDGVELTNAIIPGSLRWADENDAETGTNQEDR